MLARIATLSVLALSFALGASDPQVNLEKPAVIGGTQIKAGTYKIQLNGDKAVLTNGKTSVEADVNVETGAAKYASTSACCLDTDGTYHLKEVRLGGTNKKILFKDKNTAQAGN